MITHNYLFSIAKYLKSNRANWMQSCAILCGMMLWMASSVSANQNHDNPPPNKEDAKAPKELPPPQQGKIVPCCQNANKNQKPDPLLDLASKSEKTTTSDEKTNGPTTKPNATTKPLLPKCVEIKPSEALGPIRLGMTKTELRDLDLPVKYIQGWGNSVAMLGPYRVIFDIDAEDHKVFAVQLEMPAQPVCLKLGQIEVSSSRPNEGIASRFGVCYGMDSNEGGNVITCANSGLLLLSNKTPQGLWRAVHVQANVPATATNLVCMAYLILGSHLSLPDKELYAKKQQPVHFRLQSGQTYCLQQKHISLTTKPEQISSILQGECRSTKTTWGDLIYCNKSGIIFLFDKDNALQAVRFYDSSSLPLPSLEKLKQIDPLCCEIDPTNPSKPETAPSKPETSAPPKPETSAPPKPETSTPENNILAPEQKPQQNVPSTHTAHNK
jgi:hypothetical protein